MFTSQIYNTKIIIGRENIPAKDDLSWWSMHYKYRNKKTGKMFRLEDLQEKYNLGFSQKELWNIIEFEYKTEEVYIMNINHPKYKENDISDDIVFADFFLATNY